MNTNQCVALSATFFIIFLHACGPQGAPTPRSRSESSKPRLNASLATASVGHTANGQANAITNATAYGEAEKPAGGNTAAPGTATFFSAQPILSEGPKNWMTSLFSQKPGIKIKDILIPGTHNSATYAISSSSSLSPGTSSNYDLPGVKSVVAGWSKCQEKTITQQLEDGIRFFDLRIAFKGDSAYIAHALLSISLQEALQQFKNFSALHPKEIILIAAKLGSEYSGSISEGSRASQKHLALNLITQGLPRSQLGLSNPQASFGELWAANTSIIVMQESYDFNTKWHNKQSKNDLYNSADTYLATVSNTKPMELSLILTADTDAIIRSIPIIGGVAGEIKDFGTTVYDAGKDAIDAIGGLFLTTGTSDSLYDYEKSTINSAEGWIKEWKNKGRALNIVSLDFYHTSNIVAAMLQMNETIVSKTN